MSVSKPSQPRPSAAVLEGVSGRFLDVDLAVRSWSVYKVSRSDQALYLGGKGLGLKIWHDVVGEENFASADPLGPGNPVVFAVGVMSGTTAACSARFETVTRSPLTGLMVCSSCGGPFGEACRTAGWDGLIVRGRAETPMLLRIHRDGAELENAAGLWGLDTGAAQDALDLGSRDGAVVIGPAGENGVSYANARSGHRFIGRGGIGAVMGAKNLKAVVARGGDFRIVPADPAPFERNTALAGKRIQRNAATKAYRLYGTSSNVLPGIRHGFSPVRNFRDRRHPDTELTSGEAMAGRYDTRHSVCRRCTVLCGHKGTYPDGVTRQIPEYETVGMFGSNILNFNPDLIGEWNELMNEAGMDTISAGGTIAWAMEAGEKGLRPTELRFGRTGNIAQVIGDIARRRGEGAELADGSRRLAQRYGGMDFAIQVKGLEVAAYDPRASWGQGLGYAVNNRGGCHLGSYLISLELLMGYMPPRVTLGKARWVAFMEDIFNGVNSLQVCLFTVFGILTEPPIPRLLPRAVLNAATILTPRLAIALMDWRVLADYFRSVTGLPLGKWGFLRAGERITKLERRMNVLLGLTGDQDTLPRRFTAEVPADFEGPNTTVPIGRMVRSYYKVRRYGADGAPNLKDLRRLKIVDPRGTGVSCHTAVRPWGRPLKTAWCAAVLAVLGWFIPAVACRRESVRDEVRAFPDGFRFRLGVFPAGPSVSFRREGDHLVRIAGRSPEVDMDVSLRSIDAAWLLFSFQESTCRSEASGRLAVRGDLSDTCTFIRLMDKVEILLLPRFIAKRAVKKWERVK